jgi:phage minor structural protein
VTEEANGAFELEMEYPGNGIHAEHITDRSIIKAKVDQYREPQLFRVYAQNKTITGSVKVYAEHISYDLSGIPVKPFAATNAPAALSGLSSNAVVDCPFEFWTDKETEGGFAVPVPASIRSRLGGVSGSILDVYGGEFEWDNFTVKLHNNRGADRGVQIRYGKNLTDLKQEQNCSAVYTGVYPYWTSMDGNLMELPERIVNAPGTYDFVRIKTVDFSMEFQEKPTEEQLRAYTERYIKNNDIGVPKVSLKVSFAQLNQSEEYKHLKLLERVSLFDTVSVVFPALNVSAKAKVVKTVYNVMLDRMESVTLGSVRANIADTIVSQSKEIASKPTKTALEQAREAATEWLTNGKGYKVERRDDMGNTIDTLYMDTPDIETAVNVLRVGQSGIGFSHNGVNGPYESAWTIDGKFNADFITVGTLYGILVKAGAIESADGKISINLSSNSGAAIFNSGVQTNNKFYVMNASESSVLFKIEKAKNAKTKTEYFDMAGFDEQYKPVFRVTKSFDANGNAQGSLFELRHGGYALDGGSHVRIDTDVDSNSIYFSGSGGSMNMTVQNNSLKWTLPGDSFPKYVSWKSNGDGTYSLIGKTSI